MKMYIWNNPWQPSYGGSCLYVMASSLTQARKLALESVDAGFGMVGRDKPIKLDALGPPDRVIDKPYAECYHWCE